MLSTERVSGIYRTDQNLMTVVHGGLDPHVGRLLGMTLLWPAKMQPTKIEWLAATIFFSDEPEEVYFTCDMVHAALMEIVQNEKTTGTLSDEYAVPDDVIMAQAEQRHRQLREFALASGYSATTATTLGFIVTESERFSHSNYSYALKGMPISPLLRKAMQYDPMIQGDRPGIEDARPDLGKRTKVGRNDKCPCGSGRKYKVCCGPSATFAGDYSQLPTKTLGGTAILAKLRSVFEAYHPISDDVLRAVLLTMNQGTIIIQPSLDKPDDTLVLAVNEGT